LALGIGQILIESIKCPWLFFQFLEQKSLALCLLCASHLTINFS
jgi:hypothetical protein